MNSYIKIAAITMFTMILLGSSVFAIVIDFEDGVDGQSITSPIPGMVFTATGNKPWIYGDWTTGNYNGPYPNGAYWTPGDFFAWLGAHQGEGIITFTDDAYATYLTISYSSQDAIALEAYGRGGALLDQQTGPGNLGTGATDFLTVSGEDIGYVKIIEASGYTNLWTIDDMDTDAVIECIEDADCDDGDFCNGIELCNDFKCELAAEPACPDDGLFCNGDEFCDAEAQACDSTAPPCVDDGDFCNGTESCSETQDKCLNSGNPCLGDQLCNEILDQCEDQEEDDQTEDPEDEDLWPKGEVSGGCCGC